MLARALFFGVEVGQHRHVYCPGPLTPTTRPYPAISFSLMRLLLQSGSNVYGTVGKGGRVGFNHSLGHAELLLVKSTAERTFNVSRNSRCPEPPMAGMTGGDHPLRVCLQSTCISKQKCLDHWPLLVPSLILSRRCIGAMVRGRIICCCTKRRQIYVQ